EIALLEAIETFLDLRLDVIGDGGIVKQIAILVTYQRYELLVFGLEIMRSHYRRSTPPPSFVRSLPHAVVPRLHEAAMKEAFFSPSQSAAYHLPMHEVTVRLGAEVSTPAYLTLPKNPKGIVVF